ncbi:MAG TPA: class I SAM-dependent methyltransferase [Candidatus Limnocylindria bacterium]|nr:class I SAM-dependent methyltransferase [Candidatus Limnocylindria bacterium]
MRAILPAWTRPDEQLYERLGEVIDPERKVLEALDRIVPLSGKRIADVGTGIGHYPMLLARRTSRTYGIEADDSLRSVARRRADDAHQPNIRIVAGEPERLPLRDGAVDIVLSGTIRPDDASLPAVAEALRVLRPGGRLVVLGYYGRDDLEGLLEPHVVSDALDATQRRTGWWLRNDFKIKVVHSRLDVSNEDVARELLPRLYGDRGRAFLDGPHPTSLKLKIGLFHRARA